MNRQCSPIAAIVNHVEHTGSRTSGRRGFAAWAATEPALAGWASAADVATAIRTTEPETVDRLIVALLSVSGELAELTVVSGLSRRLARIIAGWAAAGVDRRELAEREAELVAECWAAVHAGATSGTVPDPPGLKLVDIARDAVRVPRRRTQRAEDQHVPLDHAAPEPACPDRGTPAERLTTHIADAVRAGHLSAPEAEVILRTRVAGYSIGETAARLGCSPGVLRVTRSRIERRLAAAA